MPRLENHDYRSPCTYHITLNKRPEVPDFSLPTGCPENWYLYHYPIGKAIEQAIKVVLKAHPDMEVYTYRIMPDHVHILMRVTRYLDEALGNYIGRMKVEALHLAWDRDYPLESLFVSDFHDRIVWPGQSLDTVFKYVNNNPFRLLVRKFYPEFFRRVNYVFDYGGCRWQAYGNMQLLDNPFKNAVVCHRKDSAYPSIKKANLRNWLHIAGNGGVLVSPFISADEKEVRAKAEEEDAKIILLTNEPFGERFKPAGRDFGQCEKGRLLILAPDRELPECRQTWLFLNELAEWMSGWR